jgi:hypothetical protein
MSKQRYEREIEEILAKYYEESERKERNPREERPVGGYRIYPPPTRPRPPQTPFTLPSWKRRSAGQYMLMAFGVALLAMIVSNFSSLLASVLVILAVVLFLVPILLYYTTGTASGGWSSREEKRWRGQVIDFNTRRDITNDPLAGIKRWLRRR